MFRLSLRIFLTLDTILKSKIKKKGCPRRLVEGMVVKEGALTTSVIIKIKGRERKVTKKTHMKCYFRGLFSISIVWKS